MAQYQHPLQNIDCVEFHYSDVEFFMFTMWTEGTKLEHLTLPVFERCYLFTNKWTRRVVLHGLLGMPFNPYSGIVNKRLPKGEIFLSKVYYSMMLKSSEKTWSLFGPSDLSDNVFSKLFNTISLFIPYVLTFSPFPHSLLNFSLCVLYDCSLTFNCCSKSKMFHKTGVSTFKLRVCVHFLVLVSRLWEFFHIILIWPFRTEKSACTVF